MVSAFLGFLRHFSSTYDLQFVVPIGAIILLLLFCLLRREQVRQAMGDYRVSFLRGLLMAPLLALGVLAVENYRATDYFRFNTYLNAYEFYHYYIGTKYAREVGYTKMYAASLVADSETGMKWNHKSGTIRNLETGAQINHKLVLEKADEYKALFTPERWEEFKKDINWFKDRLVQYRWDGVLRDKGYNGTPVWSMLVGGLLSNRVSTDSDTGMMLLALLDPLLILIAFLVVMWAFGPRVALFMIILLGANYMMKWWHMKGAYLRTDWVMCLVVSACLLKKKHYGLAGVLTGYAALSRIFPAVLLFGVGTHLFWNVARLAGGHVKDLAARHHIRERDVNQKLIFAATLILLVLALGWGTVMFLDAVIIPLFAGDNTGTRALVSFIFDGAGGVTPWLHLFTLTSWLCIGTALGIVALLGLIQRKLDPKAIIFLLTFLATTVGLLVASAIYWRGTDYWEEYITKIAKHSRDISTWRVGYKYIFMADFGEESRFLDTPLREWQPKVRPAWYNERQQDWWRVQFTVMILTFLACARLKGHRAYLLGFVPLFFLVAPTYYYYIMLLVPLLFFATRADQPPYAIGLALMYITGMSGFWFYSIWRQDYGTYYWLSYQVMLMCLYMLALAFLETANNLFARPARSSPVLA